MAEPLSRAEAISLRQLRLFAAIGDLRSVRRASEECSLSQPAVTQALAKLEEKVGVLLIDRRADGSYPNEFGTIFHARVKRFLALAEAALVEADAAGDVRTASAIVNRLTRSQLRTLIGTVEAGSFERASSVLDISISSLQRAARDLEGNVRIQLFYRTAAGVLVSPAGAKLGRRMKIALQEIEWAIDEIESARGQSSRQMVIGAMPFGGSVLLSAALEQFLDAYPSANIHIVNDSAPKLANSLRQGDVDFVIGLLPEEPGEEVVGQALAPTPFSIVARRGHPLLSKGRVTEGDLIAHEWVIGTEGSGRRACFDRLFGHGERPAARVSTCALTVLHRMLQGSDRLALMTAYELQNGDDTLRALPFGAIAPVPSIGILTRTDWMPTPLHAGFVDILRRQVASPRPALRAAG